MFNKEIMDSKRSERIAVLTSKKDKSIKAYKEKCEKKCEEELSIYQNENMSELQLQIYKANRRQAYQDKISEYSFRKEKQLKRQIKHLERIDKHHYSRLNRIFEVDLLRGIIILGMVIDHTVYDFTWGGIFGEDVFFKTSNIGALSWLPKLNIFTSYYWGGDFRLTLRILGVVLLAFLCGISSTLSRNNYKRGILLTVAGVIMTFGMNFMGKYIIQDSSFVMLFATLSALGCCILLYSGLKDIYKFLERRYNSRFKTKMKDFSWKYVALVCAISIFAFWFMFRNAGIEAYNQDGRTLLNPVNRVYGEHALDRYFGENTWLNFFAVRRENNFFMNFFHLFNNEGNYCVYTYDPLSSLKFGDVVMIILGAKGYGVDWLGLFPMLGYTFLGGFIGEILYKDKKSIIYYFFKKENRFAIDPLTTIPGKINMVLNNIFIPINIPGQNTVLVYILHQPVIIIFFGLIFLMLGAKLNLGM